MARAARLLLVVPLLAVLGAATAYAQKDVTGSKDHPLFSRMPGFYIAAYEENEFGAHGFRDAAFQEVRVEGRYFMIGYEPLPGAKEPSTLQIHRNYENAIKAVGGAVLFSNDEYSYMKLSRDGKEIWAELTAYGPRPNLIIVEKQGMKQEVVASADAFSKDIKRTGHAAVYGIHFDTGKSVIKPESAAALGEIAKLLKAEAALKVHVVGHTDDVGAFEANMTLSLDRANAVVRELATRHGIAAARLKASGVGPLAPVSSNRTDEGKAKNRRVELVEQ
jgi:outer membrane protein OmpA-like peptidoglycan-associated protein